LQAYGGDAGLGANLLAVHGLTKGDGQSLSPDSRRSKSDLFAAQTQIKLITPRSVVRAEAAKN
jgi:hypothetical protein